MFWIEHVTIKSDFKRVDWLVKLLKAMRPNLGRNLEGNTEMANVLSNA